MLSWPVFRMPDRDPSRTIGDAQRLEQGHACDALVPMVRAVRRDFARMVCAMRRSGVGVEERWGESSWSQRCGLPRRGPSKPAAS